MAKPYRRQSTYSVDVAGGNGGVIVPNSPSLNPTDYVAIEFRVFLKAGVSCILVDNSQTGVTYSYHCSVDGDGKLNWYAVIGGIARNIIGVRAPYRPNDWNDYVFLFSGNKISIYANRELVTNWFVSGALGVNSGPVRFGQYHNGSVNSECRFSVARVYHSNAYTFDSFLKFCDNEQPDASLWETRVYDMDTSTGSGTVVSDLSPAGNHGTFARGVWSANVPYRAPNQATGRVPATGRVLATGKWRSLKYSDPENITRDIPLQGWYRGDAVPGAVDGAQQGTWPDQSGLANDVTASGSARPTYQSSDPSHLLNGRPTFQFSGAQYFRKTTGFTGQPFCSFVVHRLNVEPTNQSFFDGSIALSANMFRLSFNYRIHAGASIGYISASGTPWRVAMGQFNGVNSICGLDGAEVAGNAGASTSTGITIGASGGNTEAITGNVAEVLVSLGALDELKRRLVKRYLYARHFV